MKTLILSTIAFSLLLFTYPVYAGVDIGITVPVPGVTVYSEQYPYACPDGLYYPDYIYCGPVGGTVLFYDWYDVYGHFHPWYDRDGWEHRDFYRDGHEGHRWGEGGHRWPGGAGGHVEGHAGPVGAHAGAHVGEHGAGGHAGAHIGYEGGHHEGGHHERGGR